MEKKIILNVEEAKNILKQLDKNSQEYKELRNKIVLSEGKMV